MEMSSLVDKDDTIRSTEPRSRVHSDALHKEYSASEGDITALLPMWECDEEKNLVAFDTDVMTCMDKELNLERLNAVHDKLWLVGRPEPPRPLHHQVILGRELVITERMDMHLVWASDRMFLKPLSPVLIDKRFWKEAWTPKDTVQAADSLDGNKVDKHDVVQRARGFLFSYAALIRHESDFRIATEKNLIPKTTWLEWKTFIRDLDTSSTEPNFYHTINKRFWYGELRLSRLNKIYFYSQTPLKGYVSRWNRYGAFWEENFAWVAIVIVYVTLILSAMQVGLGTTALEDSAAFHSASYGFTVFAILGPLAAGAAFFLWFCLLFLSNWNETKRF